MLPSDVLKECKLFLTSYKKFLQDMLRVKSDADLTMISLKSDILASIKRNFFGGIVLSSMFTLISLYARINFKAKS